MLVLVVMDAILDSCHWSSPSDILAGLEGVSILIVLLSTAQMKTDMLFKKQFVYEISLETCEALNKGSLLHGISLGKICTPSRKWRHAIIWFIYCVRPQQYSLNMCGETWWIPALEGEQQLWQLLGETGSLGFSVHQISLRSFLLT